MAAVADRELGAGEAVEVGRLANQAALPVVEQHQVVESRGAALRRTGSLTVVEIASHKVDNQRAALREVFREIEVERRYEAFGAVGQTPRALLLQRVPCKGDAFVGLHPLVVRMGRCLDLQVVALLPAARIGQPEVVLVAPLQALAQIVVEVVLLADSVGVAARFPVPDLPFHVDVGAVVEREAIVASDVGECDGGIREHLSQCSVEVAAPTRIERFGEDVDHPFGIVHVANRRDVVEFDLAYLVGRNQPQILVRGLDAVDEQQQPLPVDRCQRVGGSVDAEIGQRGDQLAAVGCLRDLGLGEEVGAFVDAPNAPFPLDNHLADGHGVALQEQVAAPAPRGLQPCGGGFVSHERSLQQIRSGGDPLECVSAREVRGRALHHAQRVAAVEQDNVGKRNGPMLFVDDSPRNRQALSQTELTAERGNQYGEDSHCFGRGVEGTKIAKKAGCAAAARRRMAAPPGT